MNNQNQLYIPADVPSAQHQAFSERYKTITKGTNRILLFAADHKIEHLNKDFYGAPISQEAHHPKHLFTIAQAQHISCFATQLGLIARYGNEYKSIPYIAKLNSKTDLIKTNNPQSFALWSIDEVHKLIEYGINICGIGYTVYLGSAYEQTMMAQAAHLIYHAHQRGLLAILWMYPRGAEIKNEHDGNLIAGAAGIANCLGADIAKIKVPHASEGNTVEQWLSIATAAAGNTKIICSGGSKLPAQEFLTVVEQYLKNSPIAGYAVGRNIFQQPTQDAIALSKALAALVF